MRKVTVFLLMLSVLALTACGKQASESFLYAKTPEEAIQSAFDLCRAGKYDQAVRQYTNGPQLFETNPAAAKSMVDKACLTYEGTAIRYDLLTKTERGEGADVKVDLHVYATDDARSKLEFNPWTVTLIKKEKGWLIVN